MLLPSASVEGLQFASYKLVDKLSHFTSLLGMIFFCPGNSQTEAIFHPSPFLNTLLPLVWIEYRKSETTEGQGKEEVRSSAQEKKGVR